MAVAQTEVMGTQGEQAQPYPSGVGLGPALRRVPGRLAAAARAWVERRLPADGVDAVLHELEAVFPPRLAP